VLKCALKYNQADGSEAGSRFYLGYTGSAPSSATLDTVAGDIKTAFVTNLLGAINSTFTLVEIDLLDITTETGASGSWTGTEEGGDTTSPVAAQVATSVEFDIARRYRGGKPRMFLPPPGSSEVADPAHWTDGFVSGTNTNMAAFMTEIGAISVGGLSDLTHVSLSYYKGFTNLPNSSGRERAVPTYRATALVDTVTGYSTKKMFGSQKRRRHATSY
jgi:hypothetical protein